MDKPQGTRPRLLRFQDGTGDGKETATDICEGYVVLRDALAKTKKVAIGLCMAESISSVGLMLVILGFQDELRKPEPYFDTIDMKTDDTR